jgi:predicted transcriptional regulator
MDSTTWRQRAVEAVTSDQRRKVVEHLADLLSETGYGVVFATAIAARLGVAETTVRRTVEQLTSAGLLFREETSNPKKMGGRCYEYSLSLPLSQGVADGFTVSLAQVADGSSTWVADGLSVSMESTPCTYVQTDCSSSLGTCIDSMSTCSQYVENTPSSTHEEEDEDLTARERARTPEQVEAELDAWEDAQFASATPRRDPTVASLSAYRAIRVQRDAATGERVG